jgi:hypothetical protein
MVVSRRTPGGLQLRYLRRVCGVLSLLAGLAANARFSACLAEEQPLEYQVKAAFLLNFTKFTQWPPNAFADGNAPLSICILGDDPFGSVIDQLVQGETADGRKLSVQRLSRAPQPKACQVLFVNKSGKEISRMLAQLGPDVLTVGEGDPFLRDGGMIAFVVDNRRVRFDINQAAAQSAGIALSSKLLSVARSVKN